MNRIQFYVDDEKLEEIRKHAKQANRTMGNLALHALVHYMHRYPLRDEDKVLGIKSV